VPKYDISSFTGFVHSISVSEIVSLIAVSVVFSLLVKKIIYLCGQNLP
jgi:hypothetical protein